MTAHIQGLTECALQLRRWTRCQAREARTQCGQTRKLLLEQCRRLFKILYVTADGLPGGTKPGHVSVKELPWRRRRRRGRREIDEFRICKLVGRDQPFLEQYV